MYCNCVVTLASIGVWLMAVLKRLKAWLLMLVEKVLALIKPKP